MNRDATQIFIREHALRRRAAALLALADALNKRAMKRLYETTGTNSNG